jgi:homoserine kinase type II
MTPSVGHCARIGAMMAGLHLAGMSFGRRQPNPAGPSGGATAPPGCAHLPPTSRPSSTPSSPSRPASTSALPQGVIHADLFRDNVLWDGDFVGGVIDFYFAGVDALLFDVAVTVNDWCADADGRSTRPHPALLAGYAEARPFTAAERAAWPAMLRAAALRFWLSRLEDFHRRGPARWCW